MRFGCWNRSGAMLLMLATSLALGPITVRGDDVVKAADRSSSVKLRIAAAPVQDQITTKPAAKVTQSPVVIAAPTVIVKPTPSQDASGLRVAVFKNVTVGKTTLAELTRQWGKEASQERVEDALSLSYQMPPFAAVEATVVDGVVASILIEFNSPLLLADAAKELKLSSFSPVRIPDQFGQALGVAYPERGVMFGFAADDEKDTVQQVLIESIAADPFVLRALNDHDRAYENSLKDLRLALSLDSKNGQAYQLRAIILRETGQYSQALKNVTQAIRYAPDDISMRLLRAMLLSDTGKQAEAKQATEDVLAHADSTDDLKARAELQLGLFLAAGSVPDHASAVEHCQAAIRLAVPLATDPRTDVRREAKNILLEAHLAVAASIAHGTWQKKQHALPKWLEQSAALAEDCILNEQGHESLRFQVHCNALYAYAGLEKGPDPSKATDAVIQAGRELIGKSNSMLYKHQVGWELGQAMVHAVAIERSRGRSREALKYADTAATLLEGSAKQRQLTRLDHHQLASLYFFAGSVHAVQLGNHEDAVFWYDKTRQQLAKTGNVITGRENEIGDWMVSMGVTYWEAGQQKEGIKLTSEGLEIMKRAIEDNRLDDARLTVPYGNLAAMHGQLGDKVKAETFSRLARRPEVSEKNRR